MLKVTIVVMLLSVSARSLRMDLMYEWENGELDLEFPSEEFRNESIKGGSYNPNDFNINGLEVHRDRLFITLPWPCRNFVTVTYVNLTDTSTLSPKLKPYPNWEAYLPDQRGERLIGQVFRVRVDRCDRLWMLGRVAGRRLRISVLDLNSDTIIKTYTFPAALEHVYWEMWIVVEDRDCQNTFAYVNDPNSGGFWTYSWAENRSWHNDGYERIDAMVLAPNGDDDFSTLYYQNHTHNGSYFISTKYLRDGSTESSTADQSGRRSEYVQLRASIFDPATNFLYSTSQSFVGYMRLLPCWNKKMECHVDGIRGMTLNVDNDTEFGDDMAVDERGGLWMEVKRGSRTAIQKFSPALEIPNVNNSRVYYYVYC